MKNWKPRVVIAGAIIIVAMVLNALGYNMFVQQVGLLAAGYLFGTAQVVKQ